MRQLSVKRGRTGVRRTTNATGQGVTDVHPAPSLCKSIVHCASRWHWPPCGG